MNLVFSTALSLHRPEAVSSRPEDSAAQMNHCELNGHSYSCVSSGSSTTSWWQSIKDSFLSLFTSNHKQPHATHTLPLERFSVRQHEHDLDFSTIPVESTQLDSYEQKERDFLTGVNFGSPHCAEVDYDTEPMEITPKAPRQDIKEGAPISQGDFFDRLAPGQKKVRFSPDVRCRLIPTSPLHDEINTSDKHENLNQLESNATSAKAGKLSLDDWVVLPKPELAASETQVPDVTYRTWYNETQVKAIQGSWQDYTLEDAQKTLADLISLYKTTDANSLPTPEPDEAETEYIIPSKGKARGNKPMSSKRINSISGELMDMGYHAKYDSATNSFSEVQKLGFNP